MPTVLLIDDDDDLRDLLVQVLRHGGFTPLSASHGRAGIALLNDHRVDLVVTDLVMPEMEGIELILLLRRTHPHLPVVAMSGGGRAMTGTYLESALALGAVRILEKPFDLQPFLQTVQEALALGSAPRVPNEII
jgi:DNA-binding NtrC family response regulator